MHDTDPLFWLFAVIFTVTTLAGLTWLAVEVLG